MTLIASFVLLLSLSPYARACGPFFPNDYFVIGGKSPVQVVELPFFHELSKTLKRADPKFVTAPDDTQSSSPDANDTSSWQPTLERDVRELQQALPGAQEDADIILDDYREMRGAMRAQADQNKEQERGSHAPFGRLSPIDTVMRDKETPIEPFDMTEYEELLSKLPREFALYVQGACAYYNEDMDKAKEAFNAVLALPEENRKFRSTWAAFMLGKSWLRNDPAQSIAFFKRTRELAEHGFADSLGLAHASEGWEARAHAIAGDFVAALHGYAAMASSADESESNAGYMSLSRVCNAVFDRATVDPRLAEDPLTRGIITTWVMCEEEVPPAAWLQAVENAKPSEGAMPDADKLAWLAYSKGDMAAADRWVRQADPKSVYAKWIQAKLLMRDGKLEDAALTLKNLLGLLDPNDKWVIRNDDPWFDEATSADQAVRGELAALNVTRGDYAAAVEQFLQANEWADAAYIAERVMTIDELEKVVGAIPSIIPALNEDAATSLRHLFARRLARLGQWEKAIPLYPDDELKTAAKSTAAALARANDGENPARDRAQALFNAAELVREHGLELVGTELAPDWFLEAGEFELEVSRLQTNDASLKPSKDELDRTQQSATQPGKRFHYRYQAADLMWECAALLPNNDTLTAEALYQGGTYLMNRDPEAADRFYKALVRRNPNLAIARQADKLRWFPEEFTDVVLYQRRPPHISKRKLVPWVAAGMACVALLGIAWALRQAKSNKRAA